MIWTPIMTFLAGTACAAGVAYLACVAWICVRDHQADRRMQQRRGARHHDAWTPDNSR